MIFRSLLSPVTKRHVERRIMDTHPLHLFRIIQDVDKYIEFIPLCSYSKVLRRDPDGRTFDGKLIVGKPPLFSENYVSRVTVIPETLCIQAESIESYKFDSLKSWWRLKEVKDDDENNSNHQAVVRCDVNFEVELTVSDPMIVAVLDKVLQEVAGRQVAAFEKRCKELPVPYDLIEAAKYLKQ
jgi:ribosome-associated toxin RatA of RatAB toxin-antitoxin module